METSQNKNWTMENAYYFTQSYYFSFGYFTYKKFHKFNAVKRSHQKA
jgi:hypothetical protein